MASKAMKQPTPKSSPYKPTGKAVNKGGGRTVMGGSDRLKKAQTKK
jgi:hypothetical protein